MWSGWIWLTLSQEITIKEPSSKDFGLPKGAFELPAESYAQMGEPLMQLQSSPPTMHLPDLRQQLIYYGKNGRLDAGSGQTLLHFSFTGQKMIFSLSPGEKLYLVYDKKQNPPRYVMSPNKEPTSLWIESQIADNEALVKVFMKNEQGELVTDPDTYAQFRLPEKEFIRYAGTTWEIAGQRVDGTLLARQKARWNGIDKFLENHGGEDFQHVLGKHRVDFGEADNVYSVFVAIGDCLIWKDGKWQNATPGEETLKHPLMVVKKIEDRLMTFELWDEEGKGKIQFNLLKSAEPWTVQSAQLEQVFKFVGAKTRTQCVFEINQERMVLSPSDWLLFTPDGWKKLDTVEDIDSYVDRKTPGLLFVFKGLAKKDDQQVMVGVLYNQSRSDLQEIELPLQPIGGGTSPKLVADNKERSRNSDSSSSDDDIGMKAGAMPKIEQKNLEKVNGKADNLKKLK